MAEVIIFMLIFISAICWIGFLAEKQRGFAIISGILIIILSIFHYKMTRVINSIDIKLEVIDKIETKHKLILALNNGKILIKEKLKWSNINGIYNRVEENRYGSIRNKIIIKTNDDKNKNK